MSLINLFVAARNAWSGWRNRQRAYGELMALDDRSLDDIGIRRSEIPAIIEGFHEKTRRAAADRPVEALSLRQARLVAGHRWLPRI